LLSFEFKFLDSKNQEDTTDYENEIFREQIAKTRGLKVERPKDGVLISGLYFESARWDYKSHCITEQKPKQLYSKVPIIHMLPTRGPYYVEPPKEEMQGS